MNFGRSHYITQQGEKTKKIKQLSYYQNILV